MRKRLGSDYFEKSDTLKKNKRDYSDASRRQHPRLNANAVPSLKSVSINQGTEARVINISRGGVLLETEVRLRPQMKILLKIVTIDGLIKMEGHILRSSISCLQGKPRYQSAISFDHPFLMLDDLSPEMEEHRHKSASDSSTGPAAADFGNSLPSYQIIPGNADEEDSAIITVITQDGMSLQDMLKLNDW
jgi:hypothetical protein